MTEKITIKEKLNNFKETHEKEIKVAEKIGGAILVAGTAGAIGYKIGSLSKLHMDALTDGATVVAESGSEILEEVAETISDVVE